MKRKKSKGENEMNVRGDFLERLNKMLEYRQINVEERVCIRDGVMRNEPKAVPFTTAYNILNQKVKTLTHIAQNAILCLNLMFIMQIIFLDAVNG